MFNDTNTMLSYKEQNNLINDDTLLIVVDRSIIPFKGFLDFVDWQINAAFSSAIRDGVFSFDNDKILMFNTEKKIGINATLIFKNTKTLASNISNIIKKLNVNNFTLLIPKTVNINLKTLLIGLKHEQLGWTKLSTKETKHERLTYFKEVIYERKKQL